MTVQERLKETAIRLFTSAKVWAAIVGGVAALLARRGIILTPEDIDMITKFTVTLVGALGLQDLGKAVAAMKTAPPIAAGGNVTVVAPVAPVETPQP